MGLHPRALAAFIAALLLFSASSPALAIDWSKCAGLFGVFSKPRPPLIPDGERGIWLKAFAQAEKHPDLDMIYRSIEPESKLAFWKAYESLPKEIRTTLARNLDGGREGMRYLNSLQDELGREQTRHSFLETLEKFHSDHLGQRFADLEAEGLLSLHSALKSDPGLEPRLSARIAREVRAIEASRFWTIAGREPVPVVSEGGQNYLVWGNERLQMSRHDGAWELEVDLAKVAHPAWNPLNTEKLTRFRVKGVKGDVYPVVLGPDGRFYLTNMNHRFEADFSGRVRVTLSDPVTTPTYREYLDLLGLPQPTQAQKERLMDGSMKFEELLPPAQRARFLERRRD